MPNYAMDYAEWRKEWPTVLASMVGLSLTTLYVYSTGAFMGPVQAEFGWSRAVATSGLTVATVCAAIIGPLVGVAVDRFGPRPIAVPGILIFCVALASVSLASTFWSWVLLWGAVGIASAGVKPTLWVTAVSRSFFQNRGLALAVTLCGAGLGSALVPLVSTSLIAQVGWRGGYVALALIWGLVTFPLVFLAIRKEAHGRSATATQTPAEVLEGLPLRASLRSWRYFAIWSAALICSVVTMAMVVSLIPLLGSMGVARTTAAQIAATVGVSSIVGRLSSGRIIDRTDPRFISAFSMAIPAVAAALMLTFKGSLLGLAAAVVLLGLAIGAELEAAAYLTARYFGLRHFGFLFSLIASGLTIGTGVGPLLAGMIFDRTGSYKLLLEAVIPLSVGAGLLLLSLNSPPDSWRGIDRLV